MSSKAEVLAKISNSNTYVGSFVKQFVNEVTCENNTNTPDKIKRCDAITVYSGQKARPSIVIKAHKDYVISLPLTSSENPNSLCESDSRFFGKGFFCNTYAVTPTKYAFERFIGIYDNPKVLNNAIKELREFIKKNI